MWGAILLMWTATVLALMLTVACQIQYAKANYPTTLSWKARLFVSGWLSSSLLMWCVIPATGWQGLVVSAFTAGLIGGLVFTFWAPINVQNIYPKK
ncbi:MAG: hypothetical protein BroJett021_31650 [Chloroflexota bacterium]|nr:MAG: hypothetical protein BroJett021_31650 [Chloroflexota bacterium]